MVNRPVQGLWTRVLLTVAWLLAWTALGALGLWLILQWRINLLDLAYLLRANPWTIGAIDKAATIVLGLLWLGFVIVAQPYLCDGAGRGVLGRRTARMLGIELALVGLSYGLQALAR